MLPVFLALCSIVYFFLNVAVGVSVVTDYYNGKRLSDLTAAGWLVGCLFPMGSLLGIAVLAGYFGIIRASEIKFYKD